MSAHQSIFNQIPILPSLYDIASLKRTDDISFYHSMLKMYRETQLREHNRLLHQSNLSIDAIRKYIIDVEFNSNHLADLIEEKCGHQCERFDAKHALALLSQLES